MRASDMIIESVALRNFKSHADTKIEFGSGINVILGDNGAGKTSILEAVSFALFKDYSGNAEKLLRTGAKAMEVSVTFSCSGRKYRVLRKRSRGVSESRLFVIEGAKEKEMRSGDTGVDEEIEEILGIDKHMFANAIYVRQGEIEKLLTETPFRKKQLIGKLIGIEALEKAWEGMKPVMDVYRERKAVAEGQIMREEATKARISEAKGQIAETRERMGKTMQKIEELEKKLSKAQADEKKLAQNEGKYAGLEVKKAELLEMSSREERRLSDIKRQLSEASRAAGKLSTIGKSLAPGRIDELTAEEKSLEDAVSRAAGSIGALEGRLSETREMKSKLPGSAESCPLCGAKLSQVRRIEIAAEKEEKIEKLRLEIKELSMARHENSKNLLKVRVELHKLRELEKAQAELLPAAGRFSSLEKQTSDGEKLVSGLLAKIKAVEGELSGVSSVKRHHAEAREASESLRREAGAVREAYGRQQGKLSELEVMLKRTQAELSEIEEKREMHTRLADFLKLLAEIRDMFDKSGLQLQLRKRSAPAIEGHMREFFREFNFDYSDISLTEDYDVVLTGPSGQSTTSMISGGERVAAALSLRLGIARALAGPGAETVLLDEPTIFLDEQRRQDLTEVLRKMSVIPQMIVVTHDPAMEDAADRVTVIKKERGVSSVSG
jgi:DNA repair protein SbcC/Rad50